EHAYWKATSVPPLDPSPSSTTNKVEVPKEFPKVSMVNTSLKELKRHLAGFDQAVEQHRLESRTFEVKMNQVLSENERLLAQAIDHDIEEALVLRDIVEHVKANYPQDSLLESAFRSKGLLLVLADHSLQAIPGMIRFSKHQVVIRRIKIPRNMIILIMSVSTVMIALSLINLCVSNSMNDVKFRAKPKKKKSKKEIWKPTGKVFTKMGYIWRPTGQTFTIVGNVCPLTRITTTNEVPSRKPIVLESESPKPVINLVYSRKARKNKNTESLSKTEVIKTISTNKQEPSKSWGLTKTNVPSSSLNGCRLSKSSSGVDLLTGSRGDNLYTLSLGNMMASSPICLLSKASKTKSWLWHRRISHLNFGDINHLAKHGLVRGLPKLKFEKDHLCSAYALGKSSKKPHKPKSEDTNQEKLYLLHMDLCG
ncbi:retrovirus-related pol polyprotein from transposon TNT 1-94, partial [Tanacetum coccineum]